MSTNVLTLEYTFGFNKDIINGVQALFTEDRQALVYAAAHTAVIYDLNTHSQTLLQGHCNPITCLTLSSDRRWLFTADRGPDSMIIIWDTETGTPVKNIFQPHPDGVVSLDLSRDSTLLATLSSPEGEGQELAVWEWVSEKDRPLLRTSIMTRDLQSSVRFNASNSSELVTTGHRRVIFWTWSRRTKRFAYHSPSLSPGDLGNAKHQPDMRQTVFLPRGLQAVTATSNGNLILWDALLAKNAAAKATDRRFVKVLRLHDRSINVLHVHDSFLVTGDSKGNVRFFDFQFRVIAWFEDLGSGSITSIAFCSPPVDQQEDAFEAKGPEAANIVLPDFIVGTHRGFIKRVCGDSFGELDQAGRKGTELLKCNGGPVHGIAFHPTRPIIAIGGHLETHISEGEKGRGAPEQIRVQGHLQLYDLDQRALDTDGKAYTNSPPIHRLQYDPSGRFLVIGFTSGMLKVVRADTLEDHWTFRNSTDCITHIAFSPDGMYFATADCGRCVALYRRRQEDEVMSPDEATLAEDGSWIYIGRNRCHYAEITDLEFSISSAGRHVLFSTGADRRLVEFDIHASSILRGFQTKGTWEVEQTAVPNACVYRRADPSELAPPARESAPSSPPHMVHPGSPSVSNLGSGTPGTRSSSSLHGSRSHLFISSRRRLMKQQEEAPEILKATGPARTIGGVGPGDIIVIANSEYKFRFLDAATKQCRRITLAPTFAAPISRLIPLPGDHAAKYVAYLTPEKVVGMMRLPLDGNLNNTMGLIAHPATVVNGVFSNDARRFVTIGGADYTVNIWTVDLEAMETTCMLQNEGVSDIHASMLEGGPEGDFHNEIVDYFHYAQLRSQGEDTTRTRRITGRVPLEQVPNIVRAIGFYPTEREIADMINDLEWAGREAANETPKTIDLTEFLRVYVNHRPVRGISPDEIRRAFEQVGAEPLTGLIQRDHLFSQLMTSGEAMSANVLTESIQALLAISPGELPPEFTAEHFAREYLGFEETGEEDVPGDGDGDAEDDAEDDDEAQSREGDEGDDDGASSASGMGMRATTTSSTASTEP